MCNETLFIANDICFKVDFLFSAKTRVKNSLEQVEITGRRSFCSTRGHKERLEQQRTNILGLSVKFPLLHMTKP